MISLEHRGGEGRDSLALDEDGVATSQQEDNERDQRKPSSIWLERCLPRKFRAIDSLFLATVVEAQIYCGDDHPRNYCSDRYKILEPSKHNTCAVRKAHVSESDEQADKSNSYVRNAHAAGSKEDLWGVSFSSHPEQGPRATEETWLYA
jgi:hypothetical protein